jgi:hypothetical protein
MGSGSLGYQFGTKGVGMYNNRASAKSRLALAAFSVLAGLMPATAQGFNTLSPAETAAGWRLLWDGTAGGRGTYLKAGINGASNTWVIDDNGIKDPNPDDAANKSADAFLYSKDEYTNFEWRVDFKVNAGGNSGLFIRGKTDWYCDGFEVAILDSKDRGDGNVRSNPANGDKMSAGILDVGTGQNFVAGSDAPVKRSGAIYEMYPTTKDGILIPNGGVYIDKMKPADTWNSMVIWANGNFIETWLNGMKVTDFEIGSADYMTRYHRSKFGNGGGGQQCGDDYGKLPGGNFYVQDHGGNLRVWLRNLKIRSFTPGSKLPAPLPTPAAGSYPGATKVTLDAGVTGAAIRYTLDGTDPTETSPLYNDSTGLTLTKSATVKAKAFRARFAASDIAAATYTLLGSGLRGGAAGSVPQVAMAQRNGGLVLTNLNGIAFTADLAGLDGRIVRSRLIGKGENEFPLAGVKTGVYLVSMHADGWLHTRKIAVP